MKTNTAWLTQEELHRKWDVSYGTIKKWRQEGLPCYEVGKNICFLDSDVTTFILAKKAVKPKVAEKPSGDGIWHQVTAGDVDITDITTDLQVIRPSETRFGYGLYCYGIATAHKKTDEWSHPQPKLDLIAKLQKDIAIINQHPELRIDIKDIMICSITDCYQPLEQQHHLTREVVKTLKQNDLPFTILTKSHHVIDDINLFKGYDKCRVGLTVVTLDDMFRQLLEPHASTIAERIEALKQLKGAGISTYCSVEPIMPDKHVSHPIAIVDRLKDYVNLFEFGIWNPKRGDLKKQVEETVGFKYEGYDYLKVMTDINNHCDQHGVEYCHAGHSKEWLERNQLKFIPYPLVIA